MYLYYLLKNVFGKDRKLEIAEVYFKRIVGLTKNKKLYLDGGVPDSIDGRYELVILHSHIFIRRLIRSGEKGKTLSQDIIDILFKDFDQSLRELGVGDLSVGKKVKTMIEGYYGRADAYEKAFKCKKDTLSLVLKRNLYGTVKPSSKHIKYIKNYINILMIHLDRNSDKDIVVKFPDIDL